MSTTDEDADVELPSMEDRLYTVKYTDSGESHLGVTDPSICADRCTTDDCESVCPADVWEVDEEKGIPTIAYENCLECGSCRWSCSQENVEWEYPETGAGVSYKFG